MPAALPGTSETVNTTGNPNAGQAILMDGLSGPKGSPFDNDESGNASTGALCTGIGWGCNALANEGGGADDLGQSFTDDTGAGGAGIDSTFVYIGGGRCDAVQNGIATPDPYTAGFLPCNAGNGGSRDGGAGPAFTGFPGKWVTAAGTVANGSVVETGYVNRSGVTIYAGQSTYGSATAAQAAPS